MEEKKNIFREKAITRVTSPEQLNEYIRVATPGIWFILIAILLALGWIRTVSDRYAEAGETVSFPQFNAMRDTQRLIQKSAPQLYAFLAQGGKLNEKQQAIYEETLAMLERTVNDPDRDNDMMARFDDMIKEIASD